jgi:hypothetical protein
MDSLRQQAHEFLGTLLTKMGSAFSADARTPMQGPYEAASGASPAGSTAYSWGRKCPVTGAAPAQGLPDMDALRRQGHELLEVLLTTFTPGMSPSTGGAALGDQVPLLRCPAPVQAGDDACATMRVANDEGTSSDVALYCTNFVADSGYEIPSLRVTVSPRRTTIPAKGEASFEIKISVSQQTPAGIYSGLIQAMGSKYVKAVLSVQVL